MVLIELLFSYWFWELNKFQFSHIKVEDYEYALVLILPIIMMIALILEF